MLMAWCSISAKAAPVSTIRETGILSGARPGAGADRVAFPWAAPAALALARSSSSSSSAGHWEHALVHDGAEVGAGFRLRYLPGGSALTRAEGFRSMPPAGATVGDGHGR